MLSSMTSSARDRMSPLEVTLDMLGLTDAEMLMLRSPGVDEAKWCNPTTHDCFRLLREGNRPVLFREGDFQVYVEDLVSLENLSMSRNRGATYGSHPVLRDSTLYLYGGYGFWHTNQAVVHFSKVTSGWEASQLHILPQGLRELHEGSFQVGEHILWSPWLAGETYTEETNQIWRTSIENGTREFYGNLPLKFSTMKPALYYETEHFVLILDLVKRIHLIRKNDLQIAELQNKDLATQLNAKRSGGYLIQVIRGDAIELWRNGDRVFAFDLLELASIVEPNEWAPFVEKATQKKKIATWQTIFTQLFDELKSSNGIELELTSDEPKQGESQLLYFALAAGLGGGILGWIAASLNRSNSSRKRQTLGLGTYEKGTMGNLEHAENLSISPELRLLLGSQAMTLSTDEFDVLMGLDVDGVAETRRARRSRIIKGVQAESSILLGAEILIRKRSPEDARKVNYKIRDFSSMPAGHVIQEIIQVEEKGAATK